MNGKKFIAKCRHYVFCRGIRGIIRIIALWVVLALALAFLTACQVDDSEQPNDSAPQTESVTDNVEEQLPDNEDTIAETGFVNVGPFDVPYVLKDGLAYISSDVAMPLEELESRLETLYANQGTQERSSQCETLEGGITSCSQGLAARRYHGALWDDGIVYYGFLESFPEHKKAMVDDAMKIWERRSPIRFIHDPTRDDVLLFEYLEEEGSGRSSWIGKSGGRQYITLKQGANYGTVLHELGHSIGLFHNHSREDRDAYITIKWENIRATSVFGVATRANFWNYSDWKLGIFGLNDGQDVGPYDYESIMHYSSAAFKYPTATCSEYDISGCTIIKRRCSRPSDCYIAGQRTHLTDLDSEGVYKLYCAFIVRSDYHDRCKDWSGYTPEKADYAEVISDVVDRQTCDAFGRSEDEVKALLSRSSAAGVQSFVLNELAQGRSVAVFFDEPGYRGNYQVFGSINDQYPSREAFDNLRQLWEQDRTDSVLHLVPTGATAILKLWAEPGQSGDHGMLCGNGAVDDMNYTWKEISGLGNNGLSSFGFQRISSGDTLPTDSSTNPGFDYCSNVRWHTSLDTAYGYLAQSPASVLRDYIDGELADGHSVAILFNEPDFTDRAYVFSSRAATSYAGREHLDVLYSRWYQDTTDSVLYFAAEGTVKWLELWADPGFSGPSSALCGASVLNNLNGAHKDATGLGNNGMSSFRFVDG